MTATTGPKAFKAALERMPGQLNWTIIQIPFDAAKLWGTRGMLRVKGEINGHAFRTSLFPNGKGGHFLMVNKQMQKGGGAHLGERAHFTLAPDLAERTITIPEELLRAMRPSKALRKYFDSLNYSTRHDIARMIASAKHAETRKRRAEQVAERLMETMEAERELPPMLQVALARNAKARAGWEKMPPGHRRSHLMGIFYYRTPEARLRRMEKAVQMMEHYAEEGTPTRRASRAKPELDI
ncbi:MAG: YdeI/OmpD-associated family protein [Candidatus Korobacteraceae bacterium]